MAWRRFWEKNRLLAATSMGAVVVQIATHVKWWAWSGDYAWGPRFMLSVIPMFYVAAGFFLDGWLNRWNSEARRSAKRLSCAALGVLVCIGLFVQALGLLFHSHQHFRFMHGGHPYAPDKPYHSKYWPVRNDLSASLFIPEYSALATHFWFLQCNLNEGFKDNPPWEGINPAFSPDRNQVEMACRFNVWWMFGLQLAGDNASSALIIVPLLLLLGMLMASVMLVRLFRGGQGGETDDEPS